MHSYPFRDLELTDNEKQYVSYYHDGNKPGVLKRVYPLSLIAFQTTPTPPSATWYPTLYATAQYSAQVQFSRRARVCGLQFLGDLASWYLDIRTSSGESFTPPVPGSQDASAPPGCLVSAMVPGSPYDARAAIGEPQSGNIPLQMSGHLDIDPNWELSPNQTLTFNGTLCPEITLTTGSVRWLGIAVHVFEFPGMAGK